jgi:histidine triad (HIT) family protein
MVYEDGDVVVFPDINPKAAVHLLVVPVPHIESFLSLSDRQIDSLTKMTKVVQRLIRDEKLERSYQLIFNGGKKQHVPHLHWHLLGD